MAVRPIPEGQPTVLPHLTVSDGNKALEFYQAAFGAEVGYVSKMPDGKVLHADIRIGNAVVFLNDRFGPPGPEPAGVTLHVWTDKIDELWDRAIKAGAEVTMPIKDQFWGDRYGQLKDPFGHTWALGMHIEDVTPEQMRERATEMFKHMGGS